MSTLHDRLADLADAAPPGGPEPELWDRGRRYARRRRVGSVVIVSAVLAVVFAIVGSTWHRSVPEELRPAGSRGGLPERVYEPSPWLPGTAGDPLGALAATIPTTRQGWFGDSEGVVGIAASTGEYRFLDLPDRAHSTDTALSPDGRYVAYWLTGRPEGATDEDEPVVGLAVYDAASGETDRHEIESEHGLSAGGFLWTDAGQLVVGYGTNDDAAGNGSRREPLQQLRVGEEHPSLVPAAVDDWELLGGRPVADRVTVSAMRDGVYRVLDATGVADVIRFSSPENLWDAPLVGPDHERVAAVRAGVRGSGSGSNPGALMTGRISGPGPDEQGADLAVLPGHPQTLEVLGWIDATTVVTRELIGPRRENDEVDVVATDVVTGVSERLTRLPWRGGVIALARDLLAGPAVPAVRPPEPWRPRDPTSFMLAVGGFGAFGLTLLVLWRRRVRP